MGNILVSVYLSLLPAFIFLYRSCFYIYIKWFNYHCYYNYWFNYNKGVVEDGVWYSNSSFKEYKPKLVTTNKSYKNDYDKYYTYDDDDKFQLIYKCKACGKEYVKNENEDAVCDVCKSIRSEEIGFIYDGVRYYYKDEGYENQMKFAF